MKITIRRTGGFAGIEQELGQVEVEGLGAGARLEIAERLQALERLVGSRVSPGADRLQYEVEVLEGRLPRRLIVYDEGEAGGAEMQALADLVSALGIALAPGGSA